MSPKQANDGEAPPAPTAEPLDGVLAALPRTRPQRASARRAAARAQKSETATTPKPPRASARGQIKERAPKQGYEPEEEVELGATVHPPSGGELIESIADIFGELVSASAGAGGRLLKDALSVFRRP